MNVTAKQKDILLNYLKEKPELIRGRVDRKSETRQKLNTIWDEVAVHLNATEGPHKSGKEWAKTWKDIKGYILKKEAKRRSYTEGTGGGSPLKIAFSNFEENVLFLLTPEAAGLENIPEDGITNEAQTNITEINQNIMETETMEIRHELENEQNLEINYLAGEVEERENIEKIAPNTSISIRNARKGRSMQQMSCSMLDIQLEKLQLKKKEIKLRRKTLKIQKKILFELRHIRSELNDTNNDINI